MEFHLSKSSHPVAVVSLPGNPNVFYEFSYTRTSSVDSSKFYSCLTCRRAKTDTRVKDVIRTIHIKDGTIRSRSDPFWGHHFACRPFTSLDVPDPVHACGTLRDYPAFCGTDHIEEFPGHIQDNSQWDERNSPPHLPFLGEVSSSAQTHGRDFDENDVEDHSGRKLSRLKARKSESIFKLWFSRQRRSRSLPQCHLCRKVLPSTKLLVQHLQRHLKSAPNCRLCGSKISPDDSVRNRRTRECCKCARKTGT
ncbi:hypothetical protein ANCCAN_04442 [Ancylostoma caninum]|uniref:C2H2-type domain-containing protein n=1 Tax=Ancylostoma caninum TaxID=29170 RepID=A0A368GYQ6_ANCCA|nr:hypothetical protein ANCCAN_04442 [Ancylostoma caninum]